jgi:hAT family C-terminal dimerisation region
VFDTSSTVNLSNWLHNHQNQFPTVAQLALDTLSIPSMAVECERTFSSAGDLITMSRNDLKEDIIEATECLKAWWQVDLIVTIWLSGERQ